MTAVYFAPRNNTLLPSARFSTSFSFDERRRDYPKMEGAVCQAYPKDTQYGESLVVKANPPLRSDSKFNHVLIFCNGISTNFSKLPINKRKISILRIISFVTCYSKIEKKPPIIRFLVSSKLSNETIQVIHLCSKKSSHFHPR